MSASDGNIAIETTAGVRTLTIDRPTKKNALTLSMYEALVTALRGAAADDEVRVLVLRGHDHVFTAGNDLADFMHRPPTGRDSPVFQLLLELEAFPKPLVAAVTGPAIGVGTTLLLHCDFVYAGENSRFHLPFVDLGLCPEGASSFLLPRLAGHLRASEWLVLAEPFGAPEARAAGLVTEVVRDAEVFARAHSVAVRIAQKPAESVRLTKELLKAGTREVVRRTLESEGAVFMQRLRSDEALRAFADFFARAKRRT